ncbi:helix-turn-helix domain-containing protein [Rhizosphaericola mali]|uniref:Helix-turn-helix transcriptional regulator n=1 Tax=Rhizosphaericola mali TaxID=2545455 RepID=A0A5P2G292_9BACT|nr:AraC family transcriptional regulator [Rhizosphaericola mali]QES89297.1 helix-turn-helix transcriptional regulator [Rhizosphaericola mali]
MQIQKIYIKNMVCPRCITAVEQSLKEEQIAFSQVILGEITPENNLTYQQEIALNKNLRLKGFEIIEIGKEKIVNQIKVLLLAYIRNAPTQHEKISEYLTNRLYVDYSHLSKLFSEIQQNTIEQYFLQQKIEFVKELLSYGELNLTEIADKLNYSSVAYLSKQFKEITHLTPTQFQKSQNKNRIALDKI